VRTARANLLAKLSEGYSATKTRAAGSLLLDRGIAGFLLLCNLQGIASRNDEAMAEEEITRNAASISPQQAGNAAGEGS